ncbi:WxL domain-containing protein, partial [Companilactobacillus alimentarius]
MKLSKNVLVGSLATAGIVLGALAPAVTAQAATSSGKTNTTDGSVSYAKDTDVGPLGGEDSKLAIAYDSATGAGDGEASAQSNANVTVQSGLLTLDAVPDFGFANAAEGTTVNLDNNDTNGNPATDSQGQDKLTVTDSRTGAPGFTVDASITKFMPEGSSDTADAKAYTLNLTPTKLLNDKGVNVSTNGVAKTSEAHINGDSKGNGSADDSNVINLAAGTYAEGPINASFNKDAESGKCRGRLTYGYRRVQEGLIKLDIHIADAVARRLMNELNVQVNLY